MHYAKYAEGSESPEAFHLWTGLSVLASAARKNVWINQQKYILYPNLFVILTGPPGKVAKSTTMRLGRALLLGVEGIKFGPDAVTVEELIVQIEKSHDGRQSALTIHSTELSSLIEPSGIKMIQFLTDIFDSDIGWKYSTKGSGKNDIKNPVVNLLGATTPSWIATGMPVNAVGHGFTSRVIFVYDDLVEHAVPFPGDVDRELVKRLINDLNHISRLEGEFQYDPGEGEQFPENIEWLGWDPEMGLESEDGSWRVGAKWVYGYYYSRIFNSTASDFRMEGYHWRKRNHILKVAMLISIASRDDLIITGKDIVAAWQILEGTEKKMVRTFSALGKYEYASDLERILGDIQNSGGMKQEEIFQRNYAAGDITELNRIFDMLLKMRKIKRVLDKEGSVKFVPF